MSYEISVCSICNLPLQYFVFPSNVYVIITVIRNSTIMVSKHDLFTQNSIFVYVADLLGHQFMSIRYVRRMPPLFAFI